MNQIPHQPSLYHHHPLASVMLPPPTAPVPPYTPLCGLLYPHPLSDLPPSHLRPVPFPSSSASSSASSSSIPAAHCHHHPKTSTTISGSSPINTAPSTTNTTPATSMTTSLTSSPFDPVHHAACHHPSPPPPHHHRQHQHDLHPRPASSALSPHVKRFRTSTTSPTKPNTTEPIAADTFHDDDDTDDYDDDDTNDDDDDDDDEDDALSCQFKFSAGVGNQTHDSSQEFHDHCFTQSGDRYSLMKLELERLMKHHEEHFKFRHKYSELLGQFEREQRRADERERLFDNAVIDNDDDDEDDDDSDYDFDDDSDFDDCDVDDDSDEGEGDHGDHPSLRYEGGSAAGTGMDNTSAMDVSPPESALTTRSSSPTLWSTIYSKATVSEWASSGSASSKCAPGPRRVSAAAQLGVRRSKPIPIPYSSSAGSCKMSCGKVSAAAHEAGTCHSYQLTPHSAAHRVGGL